VGAEYGAAAFRFEEVFEGGIILLVWWVASCRGFCDFHRFFGWFFVVKMWWFDGEIVVLRGRVFVG
jgi:hypothetical protein